MVRIYLAGCVKTDATSNDSVHSTHEVAGNLRARKVRAQILVAYFSSNLKTSLCGYDNII